MPGTFEKGVGRFKKFALSERLVRRNPVLYGPAKREFAQCAAAEADERRAWMSDRLKIVLKHAANTDHGRSCAGSSEIESWPLVQKEEVRDNPQRFINRPAWGAAHASTGGTTGLPLQLRRSQRSIVAEQVCIDRLLETLGVDPRNSKMAVLRGDKFKSPSDLAPPFWQSAHGGQRLVFSSNHLGPDTLHAYVDALEAFKPDVIWVYPTSLEHLCRLLVQSGRTLRIPRVMSSSEVLRPEAWELARNTLDCQMVDYYGQAERVAFAYAFKARNYRFLPGYAWVELLPYGGADSVLHEVVGTSLWNLAMPLVRYRTGDLIRLPETWGAREREEVNLGERLIRGIMGREQEILLGPRGVRLTGIDHIPRDVEHLLRIQVIQETLEDVRILVVPGPGYSPRDAEQLMHNVRAKIPVSMRVRVEVTDWLERTPRGKTPLVIHRPPLQDLLRSKAYESLIM